MIFASLVLTLIKGFLFKKQILVRNKEDQKWTVSATLSVVCMIV